MSAFSGPDLAIVAVVFLTFLIATMINRSLVNSAVADIKAIWAYMIRRATAEALAKGCATITTSGIQVEPHARAWYVPIEAELRETYRSRRVWVGDIDLIREIERVHGGWILSNVCVPNGIYSGACLVMAAEIAREDETLPGARSDASTGASSGKAGR